MLRNNIGVKIKRATTIAVIILYIIFKIPLYLEIVKTFGINKIMETSPIDIVDQISVWNF